MSHYSSQVDLADRIREKLDHGNMLALMVVPVNDNFRLRTATKKDQLPLINQIMTLIVE